MVDRLDDSPTRALDDDELLARLKGWFQDDRDHHAEWCEEAREDFDFVAGHQWSEEDLIIMEAEKRPAPAFNRVGPMIDSVCGFEVSNRQEVRYIPRKLGGTGVNQMLTSAAQWFRDQSDAEDEESDAFRDAVIAGKGWTESRIDYEINPDGDPIIERVDPFEVFADRHARKPNLVDAKRVWRVRRMSEDEAVAMFPDADPALLSAGWAGDTDARPGRNDPERRYEDDESDHTTTGFKRECTIVECQWHEREPFIRFVDGMTNELVEMPLDEFEELMRRLAMMTPMDMAMMGVAPPREMVTQYRRVYRRAFLGKIVLEVQPCPVEGHFTFKCITGKRDRNKGQFYGLVRPMKDPQRWTNKLSGQIMHILNSNAKGGIFAERGAFEDDNQASEDWNNPEAIVWLNKNGIAKIQPRNPPAFPQGQGEMLQFSMSTMPMVTGVNLEMLGMKDAQQAGVLEYQRRQAGVTILAPLFDSLRRYRKDNGRLLLGFIQNYLADGRLVRILDQDEQKYLPLDRSAALGEYEVIVDDAPSAPNAKERNWAIIGSMMPLLQPAMTPGIAADLLRYSPLPENVSQTIAQALTKAPPPPSPEQMEAQQIAKAGAVARVDKDAASAEKSRADAMARQAATMMSVLPMVMQGLNPNLPPAPVPSGPVPLLNFAPGSVPVPNGMPPNGMAPPPNGMPAPMPTMPDMAGSTNLPPPNLMPIQPGGTQPL